MRLFILKWCLIDRKIFMDVYLPHLFYSFFKEINNYIFLLYSDINALVNNVYKRCFLLLIIEKLIRNLY